MLKSEESGAGLALFGMVVESSGSSPEITSNIKAVSSTVLAKGPIWSSEDPSATAPKRETAP